MNSKSLDGVFAPERPDVATPLLVCKRLWYLSNFMNWSYFLLLGEQAKAFFLKSNLPMPVLGQIWSLADLDKDGKLDKKEFSIACFLIKKSLTNGATIIPPSLPSSLFRLYHRRLI